MRNPPWTRDELILALELYFEEPSARGNTSHKEVQKLSELLNALPIHVNSSQNTFRNPKGVGMKLSNFLKYDPSYSGKGLERGSKLEAEVWNEFSGDLIKLKSVASAIRLNYMELGVSPPSSESDLEDEEASEGRVLTRVHRLRERNQSIVKKKKKSVLEKTGRLEGEVCSFDFFQDFGNLGNGYAECHHEVPVSELKPNQKTKLSELRIVCANCHRMIHRRRPWLSLAQLRDVKGKSQ